MRCQCGHVIVLSSLADGEPLPWQRALEDDWRYVVHHSGGGGGRRPVGQRLAGGGDDEGTAAITGAAAGGYGGGVLCAARHSQATRTVGIRYINHSNIVHGALVTTLTNSTCLWKERRIYAGVCDHMCCALIVLCSHHKTRHHGIHHCMVHIPYDELTGLRACMGVNPVGAHTLSANI